MELEKLVPGLGLCAKIPEGFFLDSAFVWWKAHIVLRVFCVDEDVLPAPTLQEIYVALGLVSGKDVVLFLDPDSMLKLWLRVKVSKIVNS